MSDALIDVMGTVPTQIVFAYALSKMLDVRRLGWFWALELVLMLVSAAFRSTQGVEFRFFLGVAMAIVPIVLASGGLPWRIFVVALAHVVLFFCEFPTAVVWMGMTGQLVADYDAVRLHLGAFLLVHAFHLVLLGTLLLLMWLLVKMPSDGESRAEARLCVRFSLVQFVLAFVLSTLFANYLKESMLLFVAGGVLVLVCLLSDALLFFALDRIGRKRRSENRAALLAGELDAYLAGYDSVVREVERTAQARHDLRNQVQVALALAERGECARARRHVAALADGLAGLGASQQERDGAR